MARDHRPLTHERFVAVQMPALLKAISGVLKDRFAITDARVAELESRIAQLEAKLSAKEEA